jgi:hypothetical protein
VLIRALVLIHVGKPIVVQSVIHTVDVIKLGDVVIII